ncbi:hypothetical protein [Nodosilinea nodulosa]|uniref:hypothetical protein n=1 Tax=Nodosilinea nodulosa TaxID=416001 RepID=UPI0012D724DB|nr:hypothetical protein [Nodosilinea nodulosa]
MVDYGMVPTSRRKKEKTYLYVWLARVTEAKDEYHWDWAKAINHVVTKIDNPLVNSAARSTRASAVSLCGQPAYYTPVSKRPCSFQWGNYQSGYGKSCPECLRVCRENRIFGTDILSFYSPSLLKELKDD